MKIGQRGQSVVELAIALPAMVLILVATVDLARVFISYQQIVDAAHDGARVASISTKTDADVTAAVAATASGLGLTSGNVGITPSTRSSGQPITVTVRYPWSPITPLVASFWGGGAITVTVNSVMVVQ